MDYCKYKEIYIIGYGKITGDVVRHVHSLQEKYGYSVFYIEHEIHEFNTTCSYCDANLIRHMTITDKDQLSDFLSGITEMALIISASNNYLFPAKVIEKDNIRIINFHNALLPNYPGRNAPSWVIFENEKYTGITWHYVTPVVDGGNIICQRETEILPDIKAYELAAVLMKTAFEAFVDCYESVLSEECETKAQRVNPNRKMYHSYDIPQNAFFDISDDARNVYRLLRAIDYGKSHIFPYAKTIVEGREVSIIRYKVTDISGIREKEGYIHLFFDENKVLQLKYKETER